MRRWIGLALVTSAVGSACALGGASAAISIPVHAASVSRTTVWLQTLDACRQAVPGGTFLLSGHNVSQEAGPAAGTKLATVDSTTPCPLQHGNCATVPTGCVSWSLAIPASGSTTYVIRQSTAPTGYVGCTGGAECRDQFVQLTVDSTGAVSATVTNIYPDGTSVVWPSSGSYAATASDPIVFHDFNLGNGSCGSVPSSHCPHTGGAVPATSPTRTPSPTPSPSPSPSPTSVPAATTAPTPAPADPPAVPPAAAPAYSQAVVQPSIPVVPLPQPSFSEPGGLAGAGTGTGVSALSLPTMPAMPTLPQMATPTSAAAPAAAAPATTGSTGGASSVNPNLAATGTGTTLRGDTAEWLAVALAFSLVLVGGAVALRSRLLRQRSSE